jgi:hypothetical protein
MTPTAIPTRIQLRRLALIRLDPLELFDAWMRAERDASISLARWSEAEDSAGGDAHAAYLAALDREAHAADVLRRRVELG